MIECQAKSTNRVTLSVRNDAVEYGSHTYERSSPQAADVGPLHLHLQNATVNPDNEFLTDFVVIGTGRQKERIHIVCSDVQSALTLSVSTKSEFRYLLAKDLHFFYIPPISQHLSQFLFYPVSFGGLISLSFIMQVKTALIILSCNGVILVIRLK